MAESTSVVVVIALCDHISCALLSQWAKADGLSMNTLLVKVFEENLEQREQAGGKRKPKGK